LRVRLTERAPGPRQRASATPHGLSERASETALDCASDRASLRAATYIEWVLKASLKESVTPGDVLTDEAATLLAAKLKTPLQIGQHLVRAFEAGFEVGTKPIDTGIVEAILSRQINDLEPQLTRNGYDIRSLVEQFDAKPAEIRQLLRGELDPARTRELMDEMRAAGLPT
jgi:hypothetical protein